jgi:2-dehydropantoate 2-reductase
MDWNFKSVAVVGAGAVGLYYGGRLAEAGEDVRFLVRSDFDVLKREGLKVESVHGDFVLPEVRVARTPEEIGPVDLVVVTWKATSNHLLPEVLPPLLHSGTQVLTLQNGLGNCEKIAAIVGAENVIGGMCFVCINRMGNGVVRHTAGGRISIGDWVPDVRGRARVIAERFKATKIPADATDCFQEAQWNKLVWNVPFNGLAVAEGGLTTDLLLANPEIEGEVRRLMGEVIQAARALGFDLGDDLIDYNVERTRPMGPYRPSTMIDYLEGREVELETIWEEPLRRGKAAGVEMPAMERLLARMKERIAGSNRLA